jgi:hypothetical protein
MDKFPSECAEVPEIDVQEASGVLELPITGWVIHPREDSVRIVGFINRGRDEHDPQREPTIILHVPLRGFMMSFARTLAAWQRLRAVVH